MISFMVMFVAALCGIVSTTSPPIQLQGCYINGAMYQPGEQFTDDCNSCVCGENGLSACTLMACLPRTCEYKGQTYEDGESFMDNCNNCVCRDGEAGCTRKACPPKPKGCEYNGNTYEDGDTFMDDCNGCFCSDGIVGCTRMACSPLAKRTSVPYLPGKCWFNGKFYDIGDTFKDAEDCNTCWCSGQGDKTAVACTRMLCQ
ncbi:hypothetical protein LOTGIDRAFT_228660 [Lottia gigantea]|uniref:VWFC domain-containing protein n=1 Tax=Lottia gigantea TaxID=225164 RepID=V4AB14_LOTGI|nr:hypothetical protein LOTGIDRAFT_228660 [Lottia gigantea]ESO93977.1 hypothetical protein LOTGIDRAFT_228660 [Lottia gigantea]